MIARRLLSFSFALLFLAAPSILLADVIMKQRTHTDGFTVMGQTQPPRDSVDTVWMGKDRIRSETPEGTYIVRLDRKVIYVLDAEAKTYEEMSMNLDSMIDHAIEEHGAAMSPEQKAMISQMAQMAKGMVSTVKIIVQEMPETRTINGWKCRKYIQNTSMPMGTVTSEIWATSDLRMDTDLYAAFRSAMQAMQPGMEEGMSASVKELKKIKGVPVQSVTKSNVMGTSVSTTQELLEYKEMIPPAGFYEIPAGYRKVSRSGM